MAEIDILLKSVEIFVVSYVNFNHQKSKYLLALQQRPVFWGFLSKRVANL